MTARAKITQSTCFLLFVAIVATAFATETETTTVFQCHRKAGQTDRVAVLLEIGGETQYVENEKPQRDKMGVLCKLEYDEKTLDVPAKDEGTRRGVRNYRKVEAVVKVGDGAFELTLRPEHRRIAVEAARASVSLFSPDGNLTRDELDAIDIQADSLLLDRLLPEKSVAVGEWWAHDESLMAAMLGLDRVEKNTVQSTLKEVTATVARFEISGRVEGTAHGAASVIEIKGRYRFDLRTHRIDWLGMLIQENRQASAVTDGVDAVSRLQITVVPSPEEPASLAASALADLALTPTEESTWLTYEFPGGGCRCRYDRRWYAHSQASILRLWDRDRLAGQCNLALLPPGKPDKLVSLEEFQGEVREALGKNFGDFVAAKQYVLPSNHRVLRVVVQGTVRDKKSETPIRWIYYHLADPQGRQVAMTFTVEQELVERFADADKSIVESLEFVEKKTDKKPQKVAVRNGRE